VGDLLLTAAVAERMSSSSIVYYTVQGDRDDPDHPNAFAIQKPYDKIVVGDVRDEFPLSGTFQ